MFSHPNPKKVLVVGGGDGGVIREVLRHPSVEEVHICEIDQMVIDCAKKYFPKIAYAWDNKKVKLICGDASVYIKAPENLGQFDVIVADTSDPVGPAAALFERPFYADLAAALAPGGRVATQGESMWKDVQLISRLIAEVRGMGLFESVEYATTQIPTYPLGQIGFIVCGKAGPGSSPTCKTPVRQVPDDFGLKYYTSELHAAAFVLPKFLADVLAGKDIPAEFRGQYCAPADQTARAAAAAATEDGEISPTDKKAKSA
jgi:spermidine synthase